MNTDHYIFKDTTDIGVWTKPVTFFNHSGVLTFVAFGSGTGAWTLDVELAPVFKGNILASESVTLSFSNIEGAKSATFQTSMRTFVGRLTHSTGIVSASLGWDGQ